MIEQPQVRRMHVLITGGSRGIGRGLVRQFLQQAGARVYVMDKGGEIGTAYELAKQWRKDQHSWMHAHQVDLATMENVKDAVAQMDHLFDGSLDLLINNAAATPHTWADGKKMEDDVDIDSDSVDAIEREWREKLNVNLTAPFLLSRYCLPMLKKATAFGQGVPGSIINIASTRAHQSEPDHEAYSATKAGLLGLTQSMAVSLGHRHKIRVNAISPGWIDVSDENRDADDKGAKWGEELTKSDHEWHPAGRVGKVEDIYKAVRYLAESEFMTGQEIIVDGGVSKKMVYPE